MNKNQTKKITINDLASTIDDLAIMVNNGFKESYKDLLEFKKEVNYQFKEVNIRFNTVDSQFKEVNVRLDTIGNQVGKIRSSYVTIDEHNLLNERVKKVERRVSIKE